MKEFYINGEFDAQQAIQNGKSITEVIKEVFKNKKFKTLKEKQEFIFMYGVTNITNIIDDKEI